MAELVIALAVLALVGTVVWHIGEHIWSRRLLVRRRVLVSLSSGRAVTGVLWTRRGRLLVLKSAELLEPGTDPTGMDGDVVIDRSQVEYVQAAG